LSVWFQDYTIADFAALSIVDARKAFSTLSLDERQSTIAQDILSELTSRLDFLGEVGLDYLSLDRSAPTLSGGEAQRIRLAAQLGSNLEGVCYILDEPNHVIDMGPGAGVRGGEIVAEGTVEQISQVPGSPTGQLLESPLQHPLVATRAKADQLLQGTWYTTVCAGSMHSKRKLVLSASLDPQWVVRVSVAGKVQFQYR